MVLTSSARKRIIETTRGISVMKTTQSLIFIVCMALIFTECKNDTSSTSVQAGQGSISGTVTDVATNGAISGVSISAQNIGGSLQTTTSDAQGKFSLTFTVDSVTSVTLALSHAGYRDTALVIKLLSGELRPLQVLLAPTLPIGLSGGSGLAQTIAFLGANPQEISVYGVGGKETAILGWEVRDSLGLPIDNNHAVSLTFTSINGPNGGEYVSPQVLTTDAVGRAFTTFNAGTRSGVAKIEATTTVGARTITTGPVRVIIDAGFAVQDHFTLAASHYNFAALDWVARTLPISVLVGDVYSNPVAPTTAVYFRSGHGVIQPSVFTSVDGQGTVLLFSGNPYPQGGNISRVAAKTIGQNGTTVSDSIIILWTGHAIISNVAPPTFAIANAGAQDFSFTVADQNGNPLSAGTRIVVSAAVPPPPDPNSQVNQVQLAFGLGGGVDLEDFLSPGPNRTDFTFTLSDGSTNITNLTVVTVTISVTGPNGTATRTFSGTVN